MKLALALQADVGDTVSTGGEVGYIGKPKNKQGTSGGKDYNFWSQFVTIEDGDSSCGVNLTFNSKEECLFNCKGTVIKVKGVLETYVKDGDTKYSIGRAKCIDAPKQNQPASPGTQQSSGDKNRSFAMSYCKDLVVAGRIPVDELFTKADKILIWLDSKAAQPPTTGGVTPEQKQRIDNASADVSRDNAKADAELADAGLDDDIPF